jgi:cytochrome b
MKPIRIWDLPTRVFHWSLAASVVVSVVTAKLGGAAMVWHFRSGYLILGLLLFRLVWGFVGGHWSRFSSFVRGPTVVWAYLRGQLGADGSLAVGHNPLGALSVLAVLAVLLAQVATGLLVDDEISNIGPLNRFVSSATAATAKSWHASWGQWVVIGLVVLHVLAIVVYTWRRHALIAAMVGGDKELSAPLADRVPSSKDTAGTRWLALVLALVCATVPYAISRLG